MGPATPVGSADAATLALWLNLKLSKAADPEVPACEVKRLKTALARYLRLTGAIYDVQSDA